MSRALAGIDKLKKEVDTLIIIPNERLKAVGNKSSTFKELIIRADEVLLNAVKGHLGPDRQQRLHQPGFCRREEGDGADGHRDHGDRKGER